MLPQQQQQLVDRTLAVLKSAAAATDAELFGAVIASAADALSQQNGGPPAVQEALLEQGLAAALAAALATGLRIALRTQPDSASNYVLGLLHTAVGSLCEGLPHWFQHCQTSSTPAARRFAREVAPADLTALVNPACAHVLRQLQHLQQQHRDSLEQQQHPTTQRQGKKKDKLNTPAAALKACAVLGSGLLLARMYLRQDVEASMDTYAQLAQDMRARGAVAGRSSGGSSTAAGSGGDVRHPALAAQDLAAAAPLVAALLRSFHQLQTSVGGRPDSSTAAMTPFLIITMIVSSLHPTTASSPAMSAGQVLGPEARIRQLATARDVPWLLATWLATTAAAAHATAGGKAEFELPAATAGGSGASSRRSGGASSSSGSRRRQGSAVPPYHAQLLAALGAPAAPPKFAAIAAGAPVRAMLIAIVAACVELPAHSLGGSTATSALLSPAMQQLDAQQLACMSATVAELVALRPFDGMGPSVAVLLRQWEVAAQARTSTSSGRASGSAAAAARTAVEPVPDVLTLVVQLVMPAAMHLAAQAADPATARRDAWASISSLLEATLMDTSASAANGNVFDGPAFQQHPTAVLAAFEAVARVLTVDCEYTSGSLQPVLAGLSGRVVMSSSLAARLAAAATDPGPAQALLCLLTSCTKAVTADWSRHAAANPAAAAQHKLEGGAMEAAGTALLLAMTAQHSQRSITEDSKASSSGESSSSADLQPLVWGFGHVAGKALYTAGAVLSSVLPEQPADARSSPEQAMAAAAVLPWGGMQVGLQLPCLQLLEKLQSEQLVPTGCPGSTQQQLLEGFSTLERAVDAMLSLCTRLAQQAPPAAALAAAVRVMRAGGVSAYRGSIALSDAQVQLLLASHAEGRRLPDALTSVSAALCGALPTKFACNDPACTSCDQLSEQQLVGGKGSVCSGCRVARFCCVEHHHRSWAGHKRACRALAAAAGVGVGVGGAGASSSSSGGKGKAKGKPKRAQA